MNKSLIETTMLDFNSKAIQDLIKDNGWTLLNEFERIKAIYNYG